MTLRDGSICSTRWDAECGGLAGTGERLGDDVAAAKQQRHRLCLDGRGLLEAHFLQGAGHWAR